MPKKPHIVLLTADQMRFDCLSAYGNLGVRTPHLDALAGESVVFDTAYCATPLCIPTRTTIGTGRWPHSNRVIINGGNPAYPKEKVWGQLDADIPTFYELLGASGYAVTHVGVQHIHSTPPLRERVPGAELVDSLDHEAFMASQGLPGLYQTDRRMPVVDFNDGVMIAKPGWACADIAERYPHDPATFKDHWFASEMEKRIAAADPSNPNLFVFQCWSPHPPLIAPEPYFSMYDPAEIQMPENVGRWYDGMPATILLGTGGQRGSCIPREDWRRIWAAYFGLVTLADACIGRVIQALKAGGFWDDAVVIFTMDHGEAIGSHRMFEKMTMYEESARVPLFVKAPGIPAGRRAQLASHVDIAPTICDFAGSDALAGCEGVSLRGPLEHAAASWRDVVFSEFHGDQARAFPCRAAMDGRFKYIHHFCAGPELYDLAADPQETRSLAGHPEHAETERRLRQKLMDWMRGTGDVLDIERHADFTPAQWAGIRK
ncbi:MAG TPA: sulfatase-like hydrolase/transferase [Terrimicrobiaceae bacterium]|nr:sulfatase-like hydrolase/transferase [Terrimicrobiaceae bacterium]